MTEREANLTIGMKNEAEFIYDDLDNAEDADDRAAVVSHIDILIAKARELRAELTGNAA